MDRTSFERVLADLTQAQGVRMTSLVVSDPAGRFEHHVTDHPGPSDVRSLSKLVVALAVGAAIYDGEVLRGRPLSPDLEIWPFFAAYLDRQSPRSHKHLRAVRLRHLLSNTMGHDEGLLFREDLAGRDPGSLLEYVFSRELVHWPGTHFAYTNAGWYLISAMVRDALGASLTSWAAAHLLDALDIEAGTWTRYGRYDAAATGLHLGAADLLTIGELLLDKGRRHGRQIVPRAWIEAMRTPAVTASNEYDPPLRASAYGYGLWLGDRGIHYCDGAGGQFLIVVPETRTVVVALAEAGDTLTVARCLGPAVSPEGAGRLRP